MRRCFSSLTPLSTRLRGSGGGAFSSKISGMPWHVVMSTTVSAMSSGSRHAWAAWMLGLGGGLGGGLGLGLGLGLRLGLGLGLEARVGDLEQPCDAAAGRPHMQQLLAEARVVARLRGREHAAQLLAEQRLGLRRAEAVAAQGPVHGARDADAELDLCMSKPSPRWPE